MHGEILPVAIFKTSGAAPGVKLRKSQKHTQARGGMSLRELISFSKVVFKDRHRAIENISATEIGMGVTRL